MVASSFDLCLKALLDCAAQGVPDVTARSRRAAEAYLADFVGDEAARTMALHTLVAAFVGNARSLPARDEVERVLTDLTEPAEPQALRVHRALAALTATVQARLRRRDLDTTEANRIGDLLEAAERAMLAGSR